MMETKICSLDSSTKVTGIAYFKNGELLSHCVIDRSKIKDVDERSMDMARSIIECLNKFNPQQIYIEQPKGRQNVELVRKLSRILGVVMGWAATHDCYYEEVMPTVWRKYIPEFNQGSKDRPELKDESIRVCRELFGFEPIDDNEADACLLGYSAIIRYTDFE